MASKIWYTNLLLYISIPIFILGVLLMLGSNSRLRKGTLNMFRKKEKLEPGYLPDERKVKGDFTYKDKYSKPAATGKAMIRNTDLEVAHLRKDIQYYEREIAMYNKMKIKFHINLFKESGQFSAKTRPEKALERKHDSTIEKIYLKDAYDQLNVLLAGKKFEKNNPIIFEN